MYLFSYGEAKSHYTEINMGIVVITWTDGVMDPYRACFDNIYGNHRTK
jgi:hypothetical protein